MTPEKPQSRNSTSKKSPRTNRTGGLGRGLSALFGGNATSSEEKQAATVHTTPVAHARTQSKPQAKKSDVSTHRKQPSKKPVAEEKLPVDSTGQRVLEVPLSSVHPNASQPRNQFQTEAIEELAQSIRNNGILQPILVHELSNGKYEIIAGERRWRAASLAGLKQVPVLVRQASPEKIFEEALIENIQRQDLNPIEEAQALRRIQLEQKLTQEALAARVGKSRPAIANALRLLELTETAQQAILTGALSAGHGRALLRLQTPVLQDAFAQHCIEHGLSVREAEKLAEHWLDQQNPSTKTVEQETQPQYLDAYELSVRKMIEQLEQSLGMKVQLKDRKQRGGRLILDYQTAEQREQLIERLLGTKAEPLS